MKQIFKKVFSICTVFLMVVVLMLSGISAVWASDNDNEISDDMKEQLISASEEWISQITALTDEDIDRLAQTADESISAIVTAWTSSRDELGTMKEISKDKVELSADTENYTAVVPVSFEKADAEFTLVFSKTQNSAPSVNIDVKYSMAETLRRAVMNTIMGIAIVFIVLIFLSFLISLFRFIPNPEAKKKAQAAAPAPAPVAAPVEVQEAADDTELIAVIAAAIAAAEGTTTDGFVVRSIRKINRKKR